MAVKKALEELKSTKLYQSLDNLSPDYADRIRTFLAQIDPILASTTRHFPYYTRHDANHGFHVCKRIEQIIAEDCFKPEAGVSLGATELFLLIASAYSHDLGMTVFPGEEDELLKELGVAKSSGWETDQHLQLYLRANHSKRGGDYISENAADLKIPRNLIGQLDWMMKSHNMSVPELDANLSAPFAAEERVIDVRQLSIILCVADAIEFSDTRVIDGVFDLISADHSKAAKTSYLENMKHICVGGSLAVEKDGSIIVSGYFDDADVLSLAHHTFDQVEEWIRGYCDIERRSTCRRLLVRPEPFHRRLELRSGRFERLGIRINKKNIIDLISSNAIWRANAGAVVRELLQNSVEACRYRAFHSPPSVNFKPEVTVRFSRKDRTISVLDNGCGMSERVVLNHFLTVGNSRSKEKAYATKGYVPIARFGIGFWSVFTIADQASVQTLAFESSALDINTGIQFEVEIEGLKDYTVFSERAMAAGTAITLRLKPDLIIDDLFQQARDQVLCSEIPLYFELDGQRHPISQTVPAASDEQILGPKVVRKQDLGIDIFRWQRGREGVDISLNIAYRMDAGRATFLLQDQAPLLSGVSVGIHSPASAICGFRGYFLNLNNRLPFDLPRVGMVLTNWTNPFGLDYSIDRQTLIENGTQKTLTNITVDLINEGYREFLHATKSFNEQSIYTLNLQSRVGGGEILDVHTGALLSEMVMRCPDLLCFKLIVTRLVTNASNTAEVRYLNVTDLARQKGVVWVIQTPISVSAGGLTLMYVQPESLTPLAYQHAQHRLRQTDSPANSFVMEPSGLASLLFDCDPESTVEFGQVPMTTSDGKTILVHVPVQKIILEKVNFAAGAQRILAVVTGRWTGAIYSREFDAPTSKPYFFLGRHRVLVKTGTALHTYLEALASDSRSTKLAETIALLKQDSEGYPPKELLKYL